ncbi:MAG: hypothetical protein WCY92_03285 [Novosphingobium sp.]
MREPSLRTSRLAIAGGLVAAIATCAVGFAIGRMTSPRVPDPPPPEVIPSATPSVPIVSVSTEDIRPLGRASLIALAGHAADAVSAGAVPPPEVEKGAGRRFDLVIPFGCSGPAAPDSSEPLRWSYDPQKQTLRISVSMTVWNMEDWLLPAAAESANSVEGFWISYPWSSSPQCPIQAKADASEIPGPAPVSARTLAIGQFRSGETTRQSGKTRSFETVQRITVERFEAMKGFVVRITGRLGNVASGAPVHCIQPDGIERRPRCIIAASFDEMRIETVDQGDALATWTLARAREDS